MPKTRREVLAAVATSAAVTSVAGGKAEPATRQAASEDDDPIATAGALVGRNFSPDERALMRAGLARTRGGLAALRQVEMPPALEAAMIFDPVLPGRTLEQGPIEARRPEVEVKDADNLAFASVAELGKLLRAGEVTSVQLTTLSLDRLKQHGPALHCVVNLTEALAMRQAKAADDAMAEGRDLGPLHGIPYGAKDLLSTADYPTTYGVGPYEQQIFKANATVVDRLAAAGAVLVAKLSLGELAMGDVWFGGLTRNPWDPEQGSSGSSAGSCSAVAAGLVPFAIGSETLGSIVSPCVVCGTCGLRPTFGRVPRTGAMPLSRTMDKLGPIARRVDDLALVLAAIAGPDEQDPTCHAAGYAFPHDGPIKVGFDSVAFGAVERLRNEEVKQAYRDALERCSELFGELIEVELPRDRLLFPTAMATVEAEAAESFEELQTGGRLDELIQQEANSWPNTFRRASLLPAVDFLRFQRLRRRFMQQIDAAMAGVDVFVTVPRLGPNLALTNLTGHPCCIGRLAVIKGRPHQIEFVGQLYGEAKLATVASRFEVTVDARNEWPRERWA